MEDFKLGSLIVAALYGLPGYIFLLILTKYSFKNSRPQTNKTVYLLSAFVFSTVLVCLFDLESFRKFLYGYIYPYRMMGGENVPTFIEHILVNTSYSTELFKFFLAEKKSENIQWIVITFMFFITAFAVVCGLICSSIIYLFDLFSRFSLDNLFFAFFNLIEWMIRRGRVLLRSKESKHKFIQSKLGNGTTKQSSASGAASKKIEAPSSRKYLLGKSKFSRFLSAIGHSLQVFVVVIGKWISASWAFLKKASVFLLIISIIVSVFFLLFAILGVIKLLKLASDLALLLYSMAMRLFKHPSEDIFSPARPSMISGLPIVEVYTEADRINKGIFVAYQSADVDDYASVTLKSVIQYKTSADLFHRQGRSVYEFPNRDSKLTISKDQIRDINVSYLLYGDFDWGFKITSHESVTIQLWYLRMIMKKHKGEFDFNKFNAWIDSIYAPHFFTELLKLIEENYSRFYYTYKHKRLVYQLLKIWRRYEEELKKSYPNLTADQKKDVKKWRNAMASVLKKSRRRYRGCRIRI